MAGSPNVMPLGGSSPEATAGQPNMRFAANPQISGGFLLEPEAGPVVAVEVKTLEQDAFRGGTTQLDAYKISSGDESFSYQLRTNIPADLRSDTVAESTTPWTTRAGGFNRRLMEGLNDAGYATLFVEPRGRSIGASLMDSAVNLSYITSIARHHRLENDELRPDQAVYVGASRAAAIGFGADDLVHADLIAPCYLRGGTLGELPKDAVQLGLEGLELGKHIGGLGLREMIEMRTTFSANPADFVQTVLAIPHLRNGDAGTMFWESMKDGTHLSVTLFKKDGWSQPDEVGAMIEERPNTHLTVLDGRHLTLANPAVLQAAIDRFDVLAEMRGVDGSFQSVDFEAISQIQPEIEESRCALAGIGEYFGVGKILKTAQSLASIS